MPALFSLLVACSVRSASGSPTLMNDFAKDFSIGVMAGRKHKSIDSLLLNNRVTLGKWFNGSQHQVVEEAVIVTPGLLARRLGYSLANNEATETEIEEVWQKFVNRGESKPQLLIRLARLCRVDPDDRDLANNGLPDMLNTFRVQFRLMRRLVIVSEHQKKQLEEAQNWGVVPTKRIEDLQDRKPTLVLGTRWEVPLAAIVPWVNQKEKATFSEIRWGNNRLVSDFGTLPNFDGATHGELSIIENDRTRTFQFLLPKS